MIKNKVQESLLSALYETRKLIESSSKEDLPIVIEAIEDITGLIMKLEGVNIYERSDNK